MSLVKELAPPGDLPGSTTFPFDFANVEKTFETYNGLNARLRYFVRVTIIRRLSDTVKEHDIAVQTLSSYPDVNKRSVAMELHCNKIC